MIYSKNQIDQFLQHCLANDDESEILEFKEAKNGYDFDKLGKYFCALSNEANLGQKNCAWLMFGVKDKTKEIVNTQFRTKTRDLHHLKEEVAGHLTNRISFIEIYEVKTSSGRVILFQIPAAPKGVPVAWKGHYYGRENEALSPLSLSELDRIRNQNTLEDWSVEICPNANVNDLDPDAIKKAREQFSKKNRTLADQIEHWDDITFLNKSKLLIQGKITRAAIILLGKPESEHFLSPGQVKLTWILRDKDGVERDYEHFSAPLLLNVEKLFSKVRNLKYRYIREQGLFPEEVDSYDPYVIREALHNCIAHQEYSLGGIIRVVENEDSSLTFLNSGIFIPGSIERVINNDAPESRYRNPFLAQAMVSLGMIDTIGSGIKKMFVSQRNRFFPLPQYVLEKNEVKVVIQGKILDLNYARKVAQLPDLSLNEIFLLDKVQKKELISATDADILRKKGLIEGRRPNIHISSEIAKVSGQKHEYMELRGVDNEYCKNQILEFLDRLGQAKKNDLEGYLAPKLSSNLTPAQKSTKIKNILQELKRANQIKNEGKIWKKV